MLIPDSSSARATRDESRLILAAFLCPAYWAAMRVRMRSNRLCRQA